MPGFPALNEPSMLGTGMVNNKVHDQFQPFRMASRDLIDRVGHTSVTRVDSFVVANIIPHIYERGLVHWRQP
jgi:hypothetical protein